MAKEFEQRKKFFESNLKLSENTKMEKKTIDIINRIFDIEQIKIDEELKKKIKERDLNNLDNKLMSDDSNDSNNNKNKFDEYLLNNLNDLQKYLDGLLDILYNENSIKENNENNNIENNNINIYEEKIKNEFNDKFKGEIDEIKKNLKTFSVPELNQQKILDIIENKIVKSLSNLNINNNTNKNSQELNQNNNYNNVDLQKRDSVNELLGSQIGLIEFSYIKNDRYNKCKQNNSEMITKYFIDTYSKFLWFYNKVYDYLSLYINDPDDKKNIKLNKEEPHLINNILVDILNENKELKRKMKELKQLINI